MSTIDCNHNWRRKKRFLNTLIKIFPATPETTAGSLRQNFKPPHLSSAARCLSAQTVRIPERDPDWPRGACQRIPLTKYFLRNIWRRGLQSKLLLVEISRGWIFLRWVSSRSWNKRQKSNSWCSKPGLPKVICPSATLEPVVESTTLHRRSKLLFLLFFSPFSLHFLSPDLITRNLTRHQSQERALASDRAC